MTDILLFGSTGLVGRAVVALVKDDARVNKVICPVRNADSTSRALKRASFPETDFSALDNAPFPWRADAIIIALGTTIRKAGSRAAFEAVDLHLVTEVARRASEAGTPVAAVVSSLGANARSGNHYLAVKGRMEKAVSALPFSSATFLRPSLLDGNRDEFRAGEKIGLALAGLARPLIPRRYRAVKARDVARALLEAVSAAPPGVNIVESEAINGLTKGQEL